MQAVADDQETPAADTTADMTTETAAPAKKSRRRWRRKKKSSAHKAGAADSNAGATPSGDKPASDTAATAPRNKTATHAAE